jgi:hypothetical protein
MLPRWRLSIVALLVAFLVATAAPSAADPPIWESTFGVELPALTGEDDAFQTVGISFPFPFAGETYTFFSVSTNGGIALGTDLFVDYDAWKSANFGDEFLSYGVPVLSPLQTDLDLASMGTVYAADFGDRAVFTWYQVGSETNELAPFTFQAQIHANGDIVFGYNGIPDDLIADLGPGIVIGVTTGDGPTDPGALDLSSNVPFAAGTTAYEVWCCNHPELCHVPGGQRNSAFDLDQRNIVFTANGSSGFDVKSVPEPGARLLMSGALGALALLRRSRPTISRSSAPAASQQP